MSKITRAVAANAEGTDVIIYFDDGMVSAAKPDDPRLVGVKVKPFASAAAPAAVPKLARLELYRRMTDDELAKFETFMRENASVRQRMNFMASIEIEKNDIQYRAILTALFGADRAAALLA